MYSKSQQCENRAKWVAALRSGEFKQAKGALRDGDAYCCLGIACEVYREAVGGEWNNVETKYEEVIHEFLSNSHVLPREVRDWLGLNTHVGGYDKGMNALAVDNDDGSTFEEIADTIEKEPTLLSKGV